jgi:chloramphenicol 3-O-phosphotransferase
MSITILSGPIGAGKTTVAQELLALFPAPVSYIEGDVFWKFVTKPQGSDPRESFQVIMRAMTAAAIPFARSGYEVFVDFSIPPKFLGTALRIVKEIPLNYIALRPSLAVCELRAVSRAEGRILDYANYRDFYALFEASPAHLICDDESDASSIARRIFQDLGSGRFLVA